MVKKSGTTKLTSSSDGAEAEAESVDTCSTDGGDSLKPQAVDLKDASSVISGISVPEDMEETLEIPEPIAEGPTEQSDCSLRNKPLAMEPQTIAPDNTIRKETPAQGPFEFMSPTGKTTKKVKKKSIMKTSKKGAATALSEPLATSEVGKINDAADSSNKEINKLAAKNVKVKVIKKTKSPDPKQPAAIPVAVPSSIEPDGAETSPDQNMEEKNAKSTKKLVKMKSSTKISAEMSDSQSVKSNDGRPKPTKKKSDNKLCSPSLSSYFEKEALEGSTKDTEEESTKISKTKKKNKSLSSSSHSRGTKGSKDEERSVRSGTKKTKRARSKSSDRIKNGSSDDKSVDTTRSRSIRSGKKKPDTSSMDDESRQPESGKAADEVMDSFNPVESDGAVIELERQNQALLEEIEILRQQLCDIDVMDKECSARNPAELDELRRELNVALCESIELKQEVEECEEALMEKDRLIKKLTDAMDAQLDKVEYLELKLQRAEEEFCNMEDEMKDMEDVIEALKSASLLKGTKDSTSSVAIPSNNAIESLLVKEMESKILELTKENELLNEYARERKVKEQAIQDQRDEEIRSIQVGINKQLQEMDDENESLRQNIEEMKREQKSVEAKFRQQIEELRKENSRLEIASQRPDDVGGNGPSEDYVYELEVEIADLREKIVEFEDHSRRQKEEIALVFVENEEVKQDLRDREVELRDLEAQFLETKATSTKKMKQKDETISFMQTEMMRIMQEKQKLDQILREKKLNANESDLMSSHHKEGADEEAEHARLQAINDQLQQLDEENRSLEEKLKEAHYTHSMRLKEKQGIILDLQEELNDAKWELGARKEGADYITLLKDRKERKRDLDKARKELKKAVERISDLERENTELVSSKQDLEKEVQSLNKSVLSMDSGEYVSGLKRQIKSLKQHNMALERKVQVESRDAEEKLRIQEAKIRVLEHDLEKSKNPARAALKRVFYNFGSNDEDIDEDAVGATKSRHSNARETDDCTDVPGQNREIATNTLFLQEADGDSGHVEHEKKGGSIWALFSPRKSTPRRSRNASSTRLGRDSNPLLLSNDAMNENSIAAECPPGTDESPKEMSQDANKTLSEESQEIDDDANVGVNQESFDKIQGDPCPSAIVVSDYSHNADEEDQVKHDVSQSELQQLGLEESEVAVEKIVSGSCDCVDSIENCEGYNAEELLATKSNDETASLEIENKSLGPETSLEADLGRGTTVEEA
jgi:hypothetical protein